MSGAGFAVVVALFATTAYHLGLILEKRALARLPAIDARHAVRLLSTLLTAPAWLAGFALMLCGFGLQVVALSRAPVSVVQPVLGSGVVILLVLSRVVLRERLGRLELACVLAMAAAIVLIALSAVGAERAGRPSGQRRRPDRGGRAWPCSSRLALGARALRPGQARPAPHARGRRLLRGLRPVCCTGWPRSGSRRCPACSTGSGGHRIGAARGARGLAVPVPDVRLLGGRDADLPDRLAALPGLDRRPGVQHHRQRVLHRGRDLAVRRAAAR